MNAICIDDDYLNNELLITLLKRYCPGVRMIATGGSVEDALTLIATHQPDLIFLDMELHDMTAKDILKAADVGKAQVILITAYEKYAIEMYKYPVVDYLLKPLLITDLISAVNKAYRTLEKTRIYDISQFQQTAERYIALPEKDHLNITKISEVVRLEAMGNYTQVYTKDGKIITSTKTLGDYENILPRFEFVRIHHSHMVNIRYVQKYLKTKYGSLVLSDGTEVPISANRKKEVTERILF